MSKGLSGFLKIQTFRKSPVTPVMDRLDQAVRTVSATVKKARTGMIIWGLLMITGHYMGRTG